MGKHVKQSSRKLGIMKGDRLQVVGRPRDIVRQYFKHQLWQVGMRVTLVKVITPAHGRCYHGDGGLSPA